MTITPITPRAQGRFIEPICNQMSLPALWLHQIETFTASEGWWEGQVEGVLEFEVAVFRKDVPKLKAAVKKIGADLGQEYMYFDAPRASVENIDCDDEKGSNP